MARYYIYILIRPEGKPHDFSSEHLKYSPGMDFLGEAQGSCSLILPTVGVMGHGKVCTPGQQPPFSMVAYDQRHKL